LAIAVSRRETNRRITAKTCARLRREREVSSGDDCRRARAEYSVAASKTAYSTVSMQMRESNTVYLSLPSGATVRFETGALDVALVRALLAELRG